MPRESVAARVKDVESFGAMRDMRNIVPKVPNAGWHFSWVGVDPIAKVDMFCHPEIKERTERALRSGLSAAT